MRKCVIYKSNILNEFYEELFSLDFRGYDSPVQNLKTDLLSDVDTFEEWFDCLINCFIENTDLKIKREDVESLLLSQPDFIDNLQVEYEDLRELYEDDE